MQAKSIVNETQVLNRLIKGLALALLITVVGFAAYYTWDRRAHPAPGVVDRAVAASEEAVTSDPTDADARLDLGDLYLASGHYGDAVAQFNAALQIEANLWRAHRGLGLAYLTTGQLEPARAELQAVIDAKKDGEFARADKALAEAFYFMGRVEVRLNNPEAAIRNLESTLAIDRTDADAWQLLGTTYLALGKAEDAANALRRAVLFVPKQLEAYQALARAFRLLGNSQGTRYAQAMVLYSSGAYQDAIRELKEVTAATPDFWDAWAGLGLSYEATLQNRPAADAYGRALAGNPNDFNARTGLVRLGAAKP